MAGPPDVARLITNSLFAPAAGSNAPPAESYIAHVQTFEEVPGSSAKKPRYLILAACRDGRLKLHKAKQNSNGTFSIGKTWALEELRSIEVSSRMIEGMNTPQPLDFTLIINGKTYRYETELPSSQQAAFLVTTVRCWRKYMDGKPHDDLRLVGFSVDNSASVRASTISNGSSQNASRRPSTPQSNPYPSAPSSSSRSAYPGPASSSNGNSVRPISPHNAGVRRPSSQMANTNPSTYRRDSPSPPPTASSYSSNGRKASNPQINPSAFRVPSPGPSQSQPPSRVVSPSYPREREREGASSRNGTRSKSPPYDESGGRNPSISGVAGAPNPRRPSTPKVPPIITSNLALPPVSAQQGPSSAARSFNPPLSSIPDSTTPILSPTPRKPQTYSPEDLVDDETVLTNVEEMLEGFEWRGGMGSMASGKGDAIEKRLVGELKALEAASIHAIMESDDRVTFVINHLDDALAELDKMDSMIGMYKTQLSLLTDDIAHIESQNRGLQVQTSNQRTLLAELDTLMNTIHIPDGDLIALTQESLENPKGIERLERAAVSLYKALLSTRDTAVGEMAAASERGEEYRTKASQFCKRLADFLAIMFTYQVDQLINPKEPPRETLRLPSHSSMEDFLGRYCGLMLFVKEIDYGKYQQICATYFTSMSGLHKSEIQKLLAAYKLQIRKPTEEELDANFTGVKESPNLRQQSIRRAGTLIRSPLDSGRKNVDSDGKLAGSEAFSRALNQITPHVLREQGFIADFLHINGLDASITFADYMTLETYFKRGATTYLATQQGKLKDIKSAMELVFGFLETEMKLWIEAVLMKDSMQIIGVLVALDHSILQAEDERNEFLLRVLQKQYQKSTTQLEQSCKDQIKSIEQTKLTSKKRKGVVPFVRVFPIFVTRVESQLEGASALRIRDVIDSNYERIVATIFDALQQMAKMDRDGSTVEDNKDQLNYHVIIIENMHHIVTVISKQSVPALGAFVAQAREMYIGNLDSYIKIVLRRPLARLLDFFQGLEQLLRTTSATDIPTSSPYSKSSLKRATSDLRAKDLRKAVEVLYKRVDKHFGDVSISNPSAEHAVVIGTVWKAIEDEVVRLSEAWRGLIRGSYPEEKVGLEFSKEDVHDFFLKARTAQ